MDLRKQQRRELLFNEVFSNFIFISAELDFKGTVSVISRDPPSEEGNFLFTTVPLTFDCSSGKENFLFKHLKNHLNPVKTWSALCTVCLNIS